MRKNTLLLIAVFAFCAFGINAQTTCKQTAEQIAKEFSAAFTGKKLDTLDANRGAVGKITLTMENSLYEDGAKGQFVVKTFANMKALEKWLTKREVDELPGRTANDLISCKKGVCSFKIDGLLHNTLFLKKVTLGFTKAKCPYIKSIYIVDGN
jgi:hypothetical protein